MITPATIWARFVASCRSDSELGPYVPTILGLAGAVLQDPAQNLAVLDRIAAHLEEARRE